MNLENVKREEDKIFMQEAIDLCKEGFYRASYIIAFLAGIESLKSKLQELSDISSEVKNAYEEILSLEKNHRAVDEKVIEVAKNNMFLTDSEFSKIDYFRTQRNIYSHPYRLKPTAIDCQHIIQSMIDIILTKTIKFGKEMIDFIIKCLTEESIFLADNEEIIENYIKDLIPRIDDSLFFYFLDKLAEFYDKLTPEKELSLIGKRIKISIVSILKYLDLDKIFSDKSKITNFIISRKKTAILCFANNKTFTLLSEQNKDIIFNLLVEQNRYQEISEIYYDNNNRNALSEIQLTKLKELLESNDNFETLRHFPAELIIKNLIKMLESHNWPTQNNAIKLYNTKGFLGSIKNCDKNDIIELGRNILQSAGNSDTDYYSNEARHLLTELVEDKNTCFEIKEGIILECITNERYSVRPKLFHIETVAKIYSNLSEKRQNRIKEELLQYIEKWDIMPYDWEPLNIPEFIDIYNKIKEKLVKS